MKIIDPREPAAVYSIVLWLVTDLGVAVSGALLIVSLGGFGDIWSPPALDFVKRFSIATNICSMIAFALSVVCFARWLYNATKRAHLFSGGMTISPGWAIGSYFIPIVNLFKPFQAMREIWQASIAPNTTGIVPVPVGMRIWWGLWLVRVGLSNANYQVIANVRNLLDIGISGALNILTFVIDVPMAVLLIVLIRRLGANHRARVEAQIFG
ncbi:MAG: DUF4328 domain-containing protein [Lysobacteraceae bacterium]|nr:MAG: DUF4328 domain-containing protein [Xanthomonadaceae bacterium]